MAAPNVMTMKYIAEKDRPLNLPYPYSFIVEGFAAHHVLFLVVWCFIVACMLGLAVSPYTVSL